MLNVKSRARKQNVGLTVTVATSQVRAIVDQAMPGVGATVESKDSWDAGADVQTVITTVTTPAGVAPHVLTRELNTLSGVLQVQTFPTRVVITRTK